VGVLRGGEVTAVGVANREQQFKVRPRPSAGHSDVVLRMQIVFLLALSAITLFAVVRLTSQVNAPDEGSTFQARGLVWGGRTFVDLHSFAQWLHARGYSYEVWAQNHRQRAGLPQLPTQVKPVEQKAAPGWLKPAVGLAAIAFAICCVVILRRRGLSRRRSSWEVGDRSWGDRVRFEASWWNAALEDLRRLARVSAARVTQLVEGVAGRLSAERGSLRTPDVDWRSVAAQGRYALRAARKRANPRTGDAFWYALATLLAITMGIAITRF
jgi:hypothetical protein